MDRINEIKIGEYQVPVTSSGEKELSLEEVSILYTTEKPEDDRSTFEDTFDETDVSNSASGQKFLNGLISNKTSLMEDLGLSSEQYDSFACIALALASQETGMGYEDGYVEENTGAGKRIRQFLKKMEVTFAGAASASSGLTQMKIYDFLNKDALTQEQKDIIKKYGIEAKGVATNNLYENPDKTAIATMVVLTAIDSNYENYINVLKDENSSVASKLSVEATKDEMFEKGTQILNEISEIYQNSDDKTRIKLRNSLKQVFLSANGSKIGDKRVDDDYNEELQVQKFNEIIGGDFSLSTSDINYIRYVLTSDGQQMTQTEYCAYGWNKGTGETGMQLDRLLADKIGVILSNPEDFDYDQFTVNVSTLASKYAEQSTEVNGIDTLNRFLEEI